MVLLSFKGPFPYKLYICLVDHSASCVVTLECPDAVVHCVGVRGLRWLLSGNRGTIHISCTVTWSQCCDGCWKNLTCCLTLEAVTCLVLVGFKGPCTYKLHICLVHDCIGCVISLEGPSAIVHCIGVSSLGWLLSGNRGTIHISCTVTWSQCCDGCWKNLTCCLTLEAVTCLVLVGFKGPCTYKLHICLVHDCIGCVISLEGPSAIVHCIGVSSLGWLLSGNRGTIHISCTIAWSQGCDGCWKSFSCCLTLEAVSSLILVSFKLPLTCESQISFFHKLTFGIVTKESPGTIVHIIFVSLCCRLFWYNFLRVVIA